jgi:hypothetical protein
VFARNFGWIWADQSCHKFEVGRVELSWRTWGQVPAILKSLTLVDRSWSLGRRGGGDIALDQEVEDVSDY